MDPGPSSPRRRVTYSWSVLRGVSGRSSSQTAVVSWSAETGSGAEMASVASSARSLGEVTAIGRPASETSNGPSTPTQR
jgi:hypothetical protein